MRNKSFINRPNKFGIGDYVDFDTREDCRYDYRCNFCEKRERIRKCVVIEVSAMGFYNLMEVDSDPRISAGHHLVSERCLAFTLNPNVD